MQSTAVSAAETPAASASPTKRLAKRKRKAVPAEQVEGDETTQEARSALRALLRWRENGECDRRLGAGRIPGDPDSANGASSCGGDDGFEDGSRREDSGVSVLAEHLTRLGFRVGKSMPSPSFSSHASAHSPAAAVSVYRDSMSMMIATSGAAKGAEVRARVGGESTETQAVFGRAESEHFEKATNHAEERSLDQDLRDFWIVLLGMHPHQSVIERSYREGFRDAYCLLRLLDLLRGRLAEIPGSLVECSAADGEANDSASLLSDERTPSQQQLRSIQLLQAQCLELLLARCANGRFRLSQSSFPHNEVDNALYGRVEGGNGELDCSEYDDDDDGCDNVDPRNLSQWLHARVFASGSPTPLCTVDQLAAEHARIRGRNSTLSNAYLQLWQNRQFHQHAPQLTRIEYHPSPNPKFERFKLFVFASTPPYGQEQRRRSADEGLVMLPCLPQVVNQGVDETARQLAEIFWDYLDRICHYQSTSDLRECISPSLCKLFASGLSTSSSPSCISLEAKFLPTYPFSLYLHGEPGTGKSSFVRCFARTLQRVLNENVDPFIAQLDTVKQMLNKPTVELELDLELRRNNNDLSLSSLLVSRRQRSRAVGASGPTTGLVVLALEELAPPSSSISAGGGGSKRELDNSVDPNQHDTLALLTQRLSGRSGPHTMESHVRSNGVVRSGISGDPSILTIMTSNYELTDASAAALRQVHLFENLTVFAMKAVEDSDRRTFAASYFNRCVKQQLRFRDRRSQAKSSSKRRYVITLDLEEGCGDVRPLVRRLRMLAYYVAAQVNLSASKASGRMSVLVAQRSDDRCTLRLQSEGTESHWDLQLGIVSDIYVTSIGSRSFCRPETNQMLDSIRLLSCQSSVPRSELVMLFEFWLSGALAPAVVLSTRDDPIESILSFVSNLDEVHVLKRIDVCSYRMMKSLYDPVDTPNLRDDIRRLGRGKVVVVELLCRDVASQLCIREMIEDTPSLAAYSSDRSALRKEGLLFLVRITGSAISPEIRSRASLIL